MYVLNKNSNCIHWLILVNVWQKPLQYRKVISLQLIKKKKVVLGKLVNHL